MMNLLWRSQRRFLFSRPLVTALTVLGIALGIAVIHATDIVNHSANASLADAHRQLHGFAGYRLLGSGRAIDEADYAALRRRLLPAHPDWRLLPVVTGSVQIQNRRWQILGIDALADLRLAEHVQNDDHSRPDMSALIGTPAALLSARDASALSARAGATLMANGNGGTHALTVAGTYADARGTLGGLLLTDIGTAQTLLGLRGQLSYLELATPAPLDPNTVQQLQNDLPPGLQWQSSDALLQGQGALLDAFQFNLAALSILALLVGCLLMFSMAQFSFWQRQPLLLRFYWLGVSVQRLRIYLLGEALLLAALACAIGWLLGDLLSRLLLPLAAATVNDLFTGQSIARFAAAPGDYLKTALLAAGAAVGVQGFLLARWQRELAPEATAPFYAPHRWIAGLVVVGAIALWLPGHYLGAAFIAVFAFSGAWLVAAPELYHGALRVLGHLPWPRLVTIALRDSCRHYRRLALALTGLCLALAAALGIHWMVGSFRSSLLDWLEHQIAADIYVSAPSAAMQTLIADYANHPAVATISSTRRTPLTLDGDALVLQAVDLPAAAQRSFALIDSTDDVWKNWRGDTVIIGEPLARKRHLAVGTSIELPTPQGPRVFTVAAIARDYSTDYGRVFLSLDTYRRHWHDHGIDSAGLYLHAGADGRALQRALADAGYQVTDSAALKGEITRLFDRTFALTRVLQWLVGGVAMAALISTLLIHQLMLRRQMATLRALGLRGFDLLRLLLLQALVLGAAAGLLAIPLGVGLAWLLVHEINPRAFGWTLAFQLDAGMAVQTVLLAVLLAALAALYPAWRSLRMDLGRELSRE